jgi:hypothetical protein
MYYSDVKREVFEVFYLNPVFFRSLVRSRVPPGFICNGFGNIVR